MRDFIILFVHVIVTVVRLAGPGGLRSVVAESALIRHQLLILNRGRKRAPNLRATDRIAAGVFTLFLNSVRILRSAIVLKPSTLRRLHSLLGKRKHRLLFSPQLSRSRWLSAAKGRSYSVYDQITRQTITCTMPCGSPIPAGATCVCDCVPGTYELRPQLPSTPTFSSPSYSGPTYPPPTNVCTCVCTCDQVCTCNLVYE